MTLPAQLLTASDVAEILRVTSAYVNRLTKRGAMPHVRLPDGEVRFDAADVEAWIDAQRRSPERSPPTEATLP